MLIGFIGYRYLLIFLHTNLYKALLEEVEFFRRNQVTDAEIMRSNSFLRGRLLLLQVFHVLLVVLLQGCSNNMFQDLLLVQGQLLVLLVQLLLLQHEEVVGVGEQAGGRGVVQQGVGGWEDVWELGWAFWGRSL